MTWNNPTIETEIFLQKMFEESKCVYICGQLEKGTEETPHIQYFMNFKNPVRASFIKKLSPQSHIEVVRRDNGAGEYCMKEETRIEGPFSFGIKPVRRNNKTDWDEVWKNAKNGELDKIPAEIRVRSYSNLKKIEKDHLVIKDADGLRGLWIYGPSGCGKSKKAREMFPDSYPKLCNKWWDGYQNQKSVIMDDIGLEHKVLGQQLKIWADRYGCILETKGGAVTSSYDVFVVTSQYSIEEIFDDEKTREALRRRFKTIGMGIPNPFSNCMGTDF